jgi:exopolysaccharide biosynthesis polyprenyl glycosylphosphotransferase
MGSPALERPSTEERRRRRERWARTPVPGRQTPVLPFPIVLQRRARVALRAHLARVALRVVALLGADVAVLSLHRTVLRGVRDQGWLGGWTAHVASALVPKGTYPAVQLLVAVVLGLLVFRNYAAGDRRHDTRALLAGSTLGIALTFWGTLWSTFSAASLVGFLLAVGAIGATLIAERNLFDVLVRRYQPAGWRAARTVVIGSAADARRALAGLPLTDHAAFAPLGFLDTDPATPAPDALGGVRDLVRVIERGRVDTVVLSGQIDDASLTEVLHIADAAGCEVFSRPRSFALGGLEPKLVWRRGWPLVQLTRPGVRKQQLMLKRALDLAGSAIGLALLSPLFAAIAAAVRLSSPGPVFFRQLRVGQGGRRFFIYKFRSMVHNAEALQRELTARSVYSDARLFKVKDDPRVTRVGAFLRRTSLDELPQLWNVLRGEMSLVGPRPPLPSEVDRYHDHHYTRFDMKPGITGPWQVSGRNNITDFDQVILLETSYLRQWSFWKDVSILLRTIPAVLKMDGAH